MTQDLLYVVSHYESVSLMEHGMVMKRFAKVQFLNNPGDSLQFDCTPYFWPCAHFIFVPFVFVLFEIY